MSSAVFDRWAATGVGRWCQAYISFGMYIFPCHTMVKGVCSCVTSDSCRKNAGKHPVTKNGLSDASNDISAVAAMFRFSSYNIGVVCGEISDLFVIDVDVKKGGKESFKKLCAELGELPPCPIVNTGGGGHHYVFKFPVGRNIKTTADLFKKAGYPGIDIRTNGGYVVWPPSNHASGESYSHAPGTLLMDRPECPAKWLDFFESFQLKKIEAHEKRDRLPEHGNTPRFNRNDRKDGVTPEWTENDVIDMLAAIGPASMGYQEWTEIGMAIHAGGFPFYIFDDWSATDMAQYKQSSMWPKWHSFNTQGGITMGTLVDKAKNAGWKPRRHRIDTDVTSVTPLIDNIIKKKNGYHVDPEKIVKIQNSPKLEKFPFDPMAIPGVIGETVKWITDTAAVEQPELALINIIAYLGAVFGRRYRSPRDIRTNVYMVGIAETGAGKDHAKKMLSKLAIQCGLDRYLGGNSIRSDSGLIRGLVNEASHLLILDEFGKLMQGISDPKAPGHKKAIIDTITALYSCSSSGYNHGNLADERTQVMRLVCPNLCIYGISTEKEYVKSLKKDAIDSGDLNRFIAIPSRRVVGFKDFEDEINTDISAELKAAWEYFQPSGLGAMGNNNMMMPDPITVAYGECRERAKQVAKKQNDNYLRNGVDKSLWVRYYENVVKIAMIFAIARDCVTPSFLPEDFDYAEGIVEYSIKYMTSLVETGMAETVHESNHNEVINFIREKRSGVGRTDLMRKFQKFKKKELDEIIAGCIDQEWICVDRGEAGAKGRTPVIYRAC